MWPKREQNGREGPANSEPSKVGLLRREIRGGPIFPSEYTFFRPIAKAMSTIEIFPILQGAWY